MIEIGIDGKRVECNTKADFNRIVSKYNGVANLFYSVNPIIDDEVVLQRAFFDVDGNKESADKIHEYFLANNLMHNIVFSGSRESYHLFLYLDGHTDNKRLSLRQIHEDVARNVFKCAGRKLTHDYNVDCSSFGDVRRLCGIPNTINMKRNSLRYRIHVHNMNENHARLARSNGTRIKYFEGDKYLVPFCAATSQNNIEDTDDVDVTEDILDYLTPCMLEVIKKENPTHQERYTLMYELKDLITEGQHIANGELIEYMCKLVRSFEWGDHNHSKTRTHVAYCLNQRRTAYTCIQKKRDGICIKPGARGLADCIHI